jgi:hypothetical protein
VYWKWHQVSDKIVHQTMLGQRPLAIEAIGLDVDSKVACTAFAAGVTGMQVRFIFDLKVGWA